MTTSERDVEILAEFAGAIHEATEPEIYGLLCDGLRSITGESTIIFISNYDSEEGIFRVRKMAGMEECMDRVTEAIGRRPDSITEPFPASLKKMMDTGRLERISGGLPEILSNAVAASASCEVAKILGVHDAWVLGYKKGETIGGICILTRQPGQELSHYIIESMVRLAAGALERCRLRAALHQSSRRVQQIMDMVTDVIWLYEVNDEGEFLDSYVSPPVDRLLGLAPGTIGNSFDAFFSRVHPGDLPEVLAIMKRGLANPDVEYSLEYRVIRSDGSERWVRSHGMARREEDGRITGCGTTTDITERLQNEARQRQLHEQLQQGMKMDAIGRLAGGIAHDFNNMLGVILANTELALEATNPSAGMYDELLEIQNAAEHSAELTRQLLAFARRQTVAPRILELNSAIAGQLRMLRRLIGENIRLSWSPHFGKVFVRLDPVQLSQILANLCINSRDAGAQRISIATGSVFPDQDFFRLHPEAHPGQFVVLTVQDNGSGMDDHVLNHLFEPFFTTRELGRGTGLGLATIHGIVLQNNGVIQVKSTPGAGAEFTIFLPAEHPEEIMEKSRPKDTTSRGNATVLIVEDEPALLKVSRRTLEKHGYTVLASEDPLQALDMARNHGARIDLLITDVVMPGMNGRELADEITACIPGIHCLFISGYTAEIIASQGILEEGVHFLQKPFSRNDLIREVEKALLRGH